MIIHQKQMEALNNAMFLGYQKRLIAFFRDEAPQFSARFSDAELEQTIAHAVPRARALGLHSADSIMQYVGFALAAGPKFDEDPKIHEFITLRGSSPEIKLKRLLQLVVRNLNDLRDSRGENG